MRQYFILIAIFVVGLTHAVAQNRAYAVHKRGMLNQTVYNSGELGRTYDQGSSGITKGFPSFEWPANSYTIIDSKEYTGQHNSLGGGMSIAASTKNSSTRSYIYCGAISNLPVAGNFSFPMSIQRIENYPVLADGSLSTNYDPDEAEEKIISRWATPIGITVTRTSRAWSYPDYDDFIIYEYELENNGNKNGLGPNLTVADTLIDVLVAFAYGLTPGKTGYELRYNRWDGKSDYEAKDVYARFDRQRWLSYAMDRDGKPYEKYFIKWASTGENGGGLQSPQAVGFLQLYTDTTHLEHKGEADIVVAAADTINVWDSYSHLKQPFLNRLETSLLTDPKYRVNMDNKLSRKNSPYSTGNLAIFGPDWVGRDAFNCRQSLYFAVGKMMIYGPYKMKPGEKIRFALAEVAGYGAARLNETLAGLRDEGGSCGQLCNESASANAFNPVANFWQTITYGFTPVVHGSTYLTNYRLPDYVNSNVVTMREVADRAIQTYTNRPLIDYDTLQYWPESASDHGVYKIPISFPSPAITMPVDSLPRNLILWGPQVEAFTASRLVAGFSHYSVERAPHPLGPWKQLDSVGRRDPRFFKNGKYEVPDFMVRIGEQWYYSVLSVDSLGNKGARTNLTLHETQGPSINNGDPLQSVVVAPNPLIVRSGVEGGNNPDARLGFFNLPKKCTIRIYSYSGQLIDTFEHNSGLYYTAWYQVTRNNQVMASGLYFFVIETPEGKRTHGKFVIIH
jgi:hypothetical protein